MALKASVGKSFQPNMKVQSTLVLEEVERDGKTRDK